MPDERDAPAEGLLRLFRAAPFRLTLLSLALFAFGHLAFAAGLLALGVALLVVAADALAVLLAALGPALAASAHAAAFACIWTAAGLYLWSAFGSSREQTS